MSNRYLFKKNKAKKGISPVIATVILVAVAVVIAAALAGFSSSLFGTYSSAGAAVTVKTLSVATDGTLTATLVNSGNVADELVSAQVPPSAPVADFTSYVVIDSTDADVTATADGLQVPPGGELQDAIADMGLTFEEGKTITVRLTMASGQQITQSVIVIS